MQELPLVGARGWQPGAGRCESAARHLTPACLSFLVRKQPSYVAPWGFAGDSESYCAPRALGGRSARGDVARKRPRMCSPTGKPRHKARSVQAQRLSSRQSPPDAGGARGAERTVCRDGCQGAGVRAAHVSARPPERLGPGCGDRSLRPEDEGALRQRFSARATGSLNPPGAGRRAGDPGLALVWARGVPGLPVRPTWRAAASGGPVNTGATLPQHRLQKLHLAEHAAGRQSRLTWPYRL